MTQFACHTCTRQLCIRWYVQAVRVSVWGCAILIEIATWHNLPVIHAPDSCAYNDMCKLYVQVFGDVQIPLRMSNGTICRWSKVEFTDHGRLTLMSLTVAYLQVWPQLQPHSRIGRPIFCTSYTSEWWDPHSAIPLNIMYKQVVRSTWCDPSAHHAQAIGGERLAHHAQASGGKRLAHHAQASV